MNKYYIPKKVWDEVTNPLPNFKCTAVELCEWISNFMPHLPGHEMSPMLQFKLIPVSNRVPGHVLCWWLNETQLIRGCVAYIKSILISWDQIRPWFEIGAWYRQQGSIAVVNLVPICRQAKWIRRKLGSQISYHKNVFPITATKIDADKDSWRNWKPVDFFVSGRYIKSRLQRAMLSFSKCEHPNTHLFPSHLFLVPSA